MNKTRRYVAGVIIVFFVMVVAAVVLRLYFKPELDDDARRKAPGSFVRLRDGFVHYELTGADSLPVVVMIHGATVPYISWDNNYYAVADAGFRVLRFDLFGRGYSDRPKIEYTQEVYTNLIYELLKALDISAPVHLVGTSMGGAVAALFTAAWPDRVVSLTLIDPAGPYSIYREKSGALGRTGKSLAKRMFGAGNIAKRLKDIEPLRDKIRYQMNYRGVGWSIYSTVRNTDFDTLYYAFKEIANRKIPAQLIWGTEDAVIPFEYSAEILEMIPHISFHAIEGAGHMPHYEKPEIVNQVLVDFFKGVAGE